MLECWINSKNQDTGAIIENQVEKTIALCFLKSIFNKRKLVLKIKKISRIKGTFGCIQVKRSTERYLSKIWTYMLLENSSVLPSITTLDVLVL